MRTKALLKWMHDYFFEEPTYSNVFDKYITCWYQEGVRAFVLLLVVVFILPSTLLVDALNPPPAPPSPERLRERAIEEAYQRYEREKQIGLRFPDPDEREAYLAGANNRLRRRLVEIGRQA